MPDDNVEIYQRMLEAFNREGVEGVMRYFDGGRRGLRPRSAARASYRGPRGGQAASLEQLDRAASRTWRSRTSGCSRRATASSPCSTPAPRARRGDLEVELRDAHMITFRDGKIAYWRLYLDQAEALADAGLDPALASAEARRSTRALGSPVWRAPYEPGAASRWPRSRSPWPARGDRWPSPRPSRTGARLATQAQDLAPDRLSVGRARSDGAQEFAAVPRRRLLRGDRRLERAARLRGGPPVQLGERQQGAAAGGRAPAAATEDEPLDQETKALLEPMITYSDNRAADAVYAQVGDEGLEEVARRAGMTRLRADAGLLGRRPDHGRRHGPLLLPPGREPAGPHRAYAKGLLARITPVERWGIPQVVGPAGRSGSRAAGGRPGEEDTSGAVTHQAALLVHRGGERLALAVLTRRAARATAAASRRSRASPSACSRRRRPAAAAGRRPERL